MTPIRIELKNGWTVSIATDTPPALCSVAGMPTGRADPPRASDHEWFDFGRGLSDQRCWTLEDLCEAVMLIQAAAPPVCPAPPPDRLGIVQPPAESVLPRWLRALFAWRDIRSSGVYLYQENSVTGERRARKIRGGHQPLDHIWLERLPPFNPSRKPPPASDD